MLSSTFKPRNGALGGAHTVSYCFLSKARARTRGQHFVRERILGFKGIIGFAKATTFRCLFKKGLLIVRYRVVFKFSHFVPPSFAYAQS